MCLLPVNPNNTTLCAKLINHLSRRFPEQEHEKFYLNYRLFSDTSSHAPGADVEKRAFTHTLSISHEPKHAFLRTTKVGEPENGQTVTIPFSSAETFTSLMLTRMQPLWNPRSALVLENGVTVSVKDDTLQLCVGEVRVAPKQQGAGTLRGLLLEVCLKEPGSWTEDGALSQERIIEAQELLRNTLSRIFQGTDEKFDHANFIIRMTKSRLEPSSEQDKSVPDWNLANLYMTVLKGQR